MCLCELADLLTRRDPSAALFFLKQSLLIFCKLEDSYKEARTLFAIGSLASQGRDYPSAFAYFVQARVIFRQRGDSAEDANCSYQLGKLATKGQQYPAAVTYFEEASNLYHSQQQPLDEAWCYYRLALVLLKLKIADATEAAAVELPVDYLTEARNLFRDAGEREAEGSCLMRLGEILKEVEPELAKACLKEALDYIDPERDVKGRRTTVVLQQLEAEKKPPAAGPAKAW
ncbi:hypothetical protein BCR35DRAFT_305458 [Leucosporidium creatinivorum]|uniref:Tetratricopeptide repeat protein 29 n=1 Tax=Leucosporidium creatinivorum TaxID=106004 RepID=A0A1Y2EZX3_9BASI|nr:hypothetical protein BCR35DRAFT_305458 [Leucosporidium creatinivorum]